MKYGLFLVSFLTILLVSLSFAPSAIAKEPLRERIASKAAEKQERVKEAKAKISEDKVANLKKRATNEITRRVAALTSVKERISGLKRLTESQKADFTTKIQTEIDSLNVLRAKIEADTDLTTLKTDVESIVKAYRVYAVFIPQMQMLVALDSVSAAADLLSSYADKLEARISEYQTKGNDVTALMASLTDMRNQIQVAREAASSSQGMVIGLTPEGYPGNKTTLQSSRTSLQTARKALEAARQDGVSIRNALVGTKK